MVVSNAGGEVASDAVPLDLLKAMDNARTNALVAWQQSNQNGEDPRRGVAPTEDQTSGR